jgi:5-methylcytosine-specific restriction endonuclease McrA
MNMTTRRLVYDKYGGRCAYCGKELRFEDMQVDHIVPVWRGRDHETLSKQVQNGCLKKPVNT